MLQIAFLTFPDTPQQTKSTSELQMRMRKRIAGALKEQAIEKPVNKPVNQASAGASAGGDNEAPPVPTPPPIAAVRAQPTGPTGPTGPPAPPENYRIMFHVMTQDHKLPDLIWNEQTRLELRR